MVLSILYSYRRCPYAMRARMALYCSGIEVEIREISLKEKPRHMLAVSPKGTVPVLVLNDGRVIDQSLDIMLWALKQRDVDDWLNVNMPQAIALIEVNDGMFKQSLDRYKYAIRFPEHPAQYYRSEGEQFLQQLESQLARQKFLMCDRPSFADIAIFPFIRQFAAVDETWFQTSAYSQLKNWLQYWLNSDLFAQIMVKYPLYHDKTGVA